MDQWAAENSAGHELLRIAAGRPRYFFPPPNLAAGEETMLVAMLLPDLQILRNTARELNAHAMWNISRGQHAEAWHDIIANYRFSRHADENSTLIGLLVSVAIESMANNALEVLLSQDLDLSLIEQIQKDRQSLPPRRRMADIFDQGERLWGLDALIHLSEGQEDVVGLTAGSNGGVASSLAGNVRIDWNVTLREMNRWYDRLAEAARMPHKSAERRCLNWMKNCKRSVQPVSQVACSTVS